MFSKPSHHTGIKKQKTKKQKTKKIQIDFLSIADVMDVVDLVRKMFHCENPGMKTQHSFLL